MKRYTKRFGEQHVIDIPLADRNGSATWREEAMDKLGKIEDLEERLGIDLLKLLSAKEIYIVGYKDKWNPKDGFEIKKSHKLFINLTGQTVMYADDDRERHISLGELNPEMYGKKNTLGGWAFTKEELED